MGLNTAMAWSVVMPVKAIEQGKSRLLASRSARYRLGAAFLTDVLGALAAAQLVAEVIVVGNDPAVAELATTGGARTLPEGAGGGLNAAATIGLGAVTPGHAAAVMVADLPCLTGAAVDQILVQAGRFPTAFVCDAAGTGTTMIMAQHPGDCRPQFGDRSRSRHAASGAVELPGQINPEPGLQQAYWRARRDVDTEIDLWDAIRIGVGPATAAALHANRADDSRR